MREVKLVMRPPGLFLRLRLNFRVMLPVFLTLIAAGLLVPIFLLLFMLVEGGEVFGLGAGGLFAVAAGANVGLFLGAGLVGTLIRSLITSPLARLLPRAVTFRVDGLRIEPRSSDAYECSWAWISSAVKTGSGMDLKIGERPVLVLHITPTMVGEASFEQLQIWLVRHGKLVLS